MTEKIPIVICVCGYEHALHPDRKSFELSSVCHSCFRVLFWKDVIPIAREAIMEPMKKEPFEMHLVGHTHTTLKIKGYIER